MNTHLAIALVVRNEISRIGATLSSLSAHSVPVFVLDTGSTDGTYEFLERSGAEVTQYVTDDMAAARNKCDEMTKSDWVLSLDADEVIDPEDLVKLVELTRDSSAVAFELPIFNYFGDGLWATFGSCRLYKPSHLTRWQGEFHETIVYSLVRHGKPWNHAPVPIHHLEIVGTDLSKEKRNRNITRITSALSRKEPDMSLRTLLALDLHAIGETDEALRTLEACLGEPSYGGQAKLFYSQMLIEIGRPDEALAALGPVDPVPSESFEHIRTRLIAEYNLHHGRVDQGFLNRLGNLAKTTRLPEDSINYAWASGKLGSELSPKELHYIVETNRLLADERIYTPGHAASLYRVQNPFLNCYAGIPSSDRLAIWSRL